MKTIRLNYPDLFCIIYDDNVRFEHEGQLIGYLKDNGNINWYGEGAMLKSSIKKECRSFIKDILSGNRFVVDFCDFNSIKEALI